MVENVGILRWTNRCLLSPTISPRSVFSCVYYGLDQLISCTALHPVGRIVFKSDLVRDRRLNRVALSILFRGRVNYLQMSSNYARGQCTRVISTHV